MHKRLIVVASFLVLAAPAPTWAGWACSSVAAGGFTGGAFAQPSSAVARRTALNHCRSLGQTGCRIVACKNNIDTKEQALAQWPSHGQ